MEWMKRHKKSCVIGGGIIISLLVFFWIFPKLLPVFAWLAYPIDNIRNESHAMQNLGLVGDSYGIYNALFSVLAFWGVVYTLYYQQRNGKKAALADRFYTLLDYHEKLIEEMSVFPISIRKSNESVVNPVSGREVFLEYKMQLKYLMKAVSEVVRSKNLELEEPDIADIAYAVFYYGSSPSWKEFMNDYLKDYENSEILVDEIIAKLNIGTYKRYALSRSNQNYLSVYFRNMYNAVKLIDSSKLLDETEKKEYIKLLRAQLSNAELYVLFFNLISRFGKKWIDNDYVSKYEIIQNLPLKYCDGYNPKEYFKSVSFESEEKTLSTFHEVVTPR